MANSFAYIMLVLWPVFTVIFFVKLKPVNAVMATILGGYMFLPESSGAMFDFPLLPVFDKESIPVLSAIFFGFFIYRKNYVAPKTNVEKTLLLLLIFVPFLTTITNGESLRGIAGLRVYDSFSLSLGSLIEILPFFIGVNLIKNHKDHQRVFIWIAVAGLFYSILALYEFRMSPQINSNVYGFFAHDWRQQLRFDGFRALIFMRHGLVASMFFSIVFMSATILWKQRVTIFSVRNWNMFIVLYLAVILILCKSVAPAIYGLFFFFAVNFFSPGMLRKSTKTILFIAVFYPLLCVLDVFPHDSLVQLAASVDQDRAASLEFRFANEEILLDHAVDKILFGWGGWGRNRPADDLVTDGVWVIKLGSTGIIGFISFFGLLFYSAWRGIAASRLLPYNSDESKLLLLHALLISMMMVDQLPNSSISSYMLLIAGSLLGHANLVISAARAKAGAGAGAGVPIRV